MKAAIGQYAVAADADTNAQICLDFMMRANTEGADLLVLPEGVLARDIADPDLVRRAAQPLNGPFVSTLVAASRNTAMTTMMTVHVPQVGDSNEHGGKAWNILIAIRNGEIIARYKKIHLYDAFAMKESDNAAPGNEVPPLVDVAGMKVGLMTCYDVRFPELARRLAVDGADVLVLPSAWVKGPMKEAHWDVLCTARALENTCYMVACGECGPRNIGASMIIDPLGVAIARAGETPTLLFANLDQARIAQARASLPSLANRRFAKPELA